MYSYTRFASARGLTAETAGKPVGVEHVVIVIDVSYSMEESDYLPSCLYAAIEATLHLLEVKTRQCPQDQVGIVTFARTAEVLSPLARVDDALPGIRARMLSLRAREFTNITAGLRAAGSLLGHGGGISAPREGLGHILARLLYEPEMPQVKGHGGGATQDRVIVLTDGDHNTGDCPVRASNQLKKRGACIDVIGIGGSPDVVDRRAPKIASTNPDGSPRYCFIGDKDALIKKFGKLAGHIKRA